MNNIFNTSLLKAFESHISTDYTEKYFNRPKNDHSFTNDLKGFCQELVKSGNYRPIIEYYIYLYLTTLQDEGNKEAGEYLFDFSNNILPELGRCNEIINHFFQETDSEAIAENTDYIEHFQLSFKEFSEEYWCTMKLHEAYSLIGDFLDKHGYEKKSPLQKALDSIEAEPINPELLFEDASDEEIQDFCNEAFRLLYCFFFHNTTAPIFTGASPLYNPEKIAQAILGAEPEEGKGIIAACKESLREQEILINNCYTLFNYINASGPVTQSDEVFYDRLQSVMAYIPFAFICTDNTDKAMDFMIKYYGQVSPINSDTWIVLINLCRGILSSEKVSEANMLWGLLSFMVSDERVEKYKNDTREKGVKLLTFLKENTAHLKSTLTEEVHQRISAMVSETLENIEKRFSDGICTKDDILLLINVFGAFFSYSDIHMDYLSEACSPSGYAIPEENATVTDSNRATWEIKSIRYNRPLKHAFSNWSCSDNANEVIKIVKPAIKEHIEALSEA